MEVKRVKKFISLFLAIIIMTTFAISMSAQNSSKSLSCGAYLNSSFYAAGYSASASSNCSGHMTSCHVYASSASGSAQYPANWTPREAFGSTSAYVSLSAPIIYASSSHGAWCSSESASEYFSINL